MKNRMMSLVMPLIFGIVGLVLLIIDHRLGTIRTADLVHVLASGVCFGVALTLSLSKVRRHPVQ